MTPAPESTVLDRLLEPVTRCLTPEVARQLVALRGDPAVQARIDVLADKCTAGDLSEQEFDEYETYLWGIAFISMLQAKARKLLIPRT
ncbi:MAG TPA: hypothetical protein VGY53_04405 [Isosphaeraceae bacterium]|jgi:hypothetical protein|nr:hypothetical protein [Isosphaeraceae bacterium]